MQAGDKLSLSNAERLRHIRHGSLFNEQASRNRLQSLWQFRYSGFEFVGGNLGQIGFVTVERDVEIEEVGQCVPFP